MRKRVILISTLLIGCLLITVGGAEAQNDFSRQESDWIGFVADSVENTHSQDSYRAEVEQNATQEITVGRGRTAAVTTNTITAIFMLEVEATRNGYNYNTNLFEHVTSEAAGQTTTDAEFKLLTVNVDGDFYARGTYFSPLVLSSSFPVEWVDANAEINRYPILGLLNVDSPDALYNAVLGLDIDEDTVLTIDEADSEESDGQSLRVFDVEYDMAALLQSDSMRSVIEAEQSVYGIGLEEAINRLAEDGGVSFTIWIGEDDGFVHRVDAIITIDTIVATTHLVQDAETDASYSDFGTDFIIEAPEL